MFRFLRSPFLLKRNFLRQVQIKPATKKEFKTEVVMTTLCPVYEETFEFPKVTWDKLKISEMMLKVSHSAQGFNKI